MTVRYVGSRAHKSRLAEMSYRDDEAEKFASVVDIMQLRGWDIDDGVFGWGACEVNDHDEYEDFLEDWQEVKSEVARR